jgi:hypothetical protein
MIYRPVIEAMFRIVNRRQETVDFILLPQQRLLDEQFSRRVIVPKGRQGAGVSSYVIGRYVAKCLAEQNRRCVIMSHETDATARLLARARFILNNLKGDLKPVLGTDNQKAITFPKTNSSLWIGTAGSRHFGRGDTISDLHLSEAAQYEHAEELAKGLLPAAEHGEIIVESTGNGVGNWYHRQCVRAREGRGFRLFFFPSHEMADNVLGFDSAAERERFMQNLDPELEEPDLAAKGHTAEFLRWRRERIQVDFEGDLRTFHQEHPITFDECFQSTGFSFFQKVRYEPTERWQRETRELWVLRDHPSPGVGYVIGADVSGGVGRDNSIAQVLRLDTGEQVAEWVSGHREPDEFGSVLDVLGRRFNGAYINVERNNHGLTTIKQLVGGYPLHLLHRNTHTTAQPQLLLSHLNDYGTLVGPMNRGLIIAAARRLVATTPIHSEMLKSEMGTFVEQEGGKIEADQGCMDDRVMAYAHAASCIERAQIMTVTQPQANDNQPDPFSWEGIFGEQARDRDETYNGLYG